MRSSSIIALSFLALGALAPLGCTQNFNIFGAGGGTGGSSSSSSSSGTTSSSSSSSSGSMCTSDAMCAETPPNPCTTDTCNMSTGKCVHTALDNVAVPGYTDTIKDCKTDKCVMGVQKPVANDADKPDNTDPCVDVTCNNGTVTTTPAANGKPCGPSPQACDGAGHCVGCMQNSDCPQVGGCQIRNCDQNHTCTPLDKNSGTPCNDNGGNVCNSMGACVECLTTGDCNQGPPTICNSTNNCVSSCTTGAKDGTESDQDCGGACPNCANGKHCGDGGDCVSSYCNNGTCAPAPNGHSCNDSAQCSSGHCVGNVCCSAACNGTCEACLQALTGSPDGTCDNINAGTTAPAGQCTAATCGNTGKCDGNGACQQVAGGTVCAAALCNGSNQFIGAASCSMSMCPNPPAPVDCNTYKCKTSGCPSTCASSTDCTSGNICDPANHCVAPLADGATCTTASQCQHGFCYGTPKVCQPDSCGDGITDGTETDVDCGGATCVAAGKTCGSGKTCVGDADCTTPLTCNGGSKKCM